MKGVETDEGYMLFNKTKRGCMSSCGKSGDL